MREIDDLRALLLQINSEVLVPWEQPAGPNMETISADIGRKAQNSRMTLSITEPSERTLLAIRSFRSQGRDVDYRTLRLVAYACCQWMAADLYAVLTDAVALETLLSAVAVYTQDPRAFRRLYTGILSAYLNAERYASWFSIDAERGFGLLQNFLSTTCKAVGEVQPPLPRIEILKQYPQILSDSPGHYFSAKWIAGEPNELANITEKLSITGNSWLAVETVKAAIQETVSSNDSVFLSRIPTLLAAAIDPRFQAIRDDIYEHVLTRYAQIEPPTVHPQLRDAVIAAWKNPWLPSNQGAWGRVSKNVRDMVSGWLKLELIHQFFETLQEHGRQDRRRFEFWRTYHEQMDDVYFALGRDAYRSNHPNLIKLRAEMDGRLFELTGTLPTTNAFIMCMGDRVVVEFSQTANAAHTFSRQRFLVDPTSKSASILQLKIASGEDRWIHRGDWEEDFRLRLAGRNRTRAMPIAAAIPGMAPIQSRSVSQLRSADIEIITFARMRHIRIEDRRSLGGNLWLFYIGRDPSIIASLEMWGFSFKQDRGWWRDS